MGMRAYYVELDSDDMTEVLDSREAPCEMLMGASMGGANMQEMFKQLGVKDSDLKQLEKLVGPLPSSMKGAANATEQKSRPNLAIEKSWQAIHFVLNGDPWGGSGLLFNVVLGGKDVGEDMGYGNPRYLDPFKVVQTSAALDRMSDEEFNKKARSLDFADKGIYVYGDRLSSDDYKELVYFFGEIRKFFHAAADKGHGILLGIM